MRKFFVQMGLLVFMGISLSGCVTINIYFPAAAAEKAADKIIEDVWQLKKPGERRQDMDKPAPAGSATQPAIQQQPLEPQQ